MDAEKEHRRQRRQEIKIQKALTQPPRLGKLKYEKATVQVSKSPCCSIRMLYWKMHMQSNTPGFQARCFWVVSSVACAGATVFRGHGQFKEAQSSSHAGKR